MPKQDDALSLPQPPSPRDPTTEEVRAVAVDAWLKARINWKALRGRAYRFTRDATAGDEILRGLYNHMWDWTLEELQGLQFPNAYATTALDNRLRNWKRQSVRTAPSLDNFDSTADRAMSLEELWETRDQVLSLLGQLPREWSEPLVLCKVYGYTLEETAQKLNLTVDTVKKRVPRAIHYLKLKATVPDHPLLKRIQRFIRRKEHRHG